MNEITKNEDLVESVVSSGVLKTESVIRAFRFVDRKDFVKNPPQAYEDRPQPIGLSQTVSQPSTVAIMLELLNPKDSDEVLDIGSGSGWTTALLAQIVGKKGKVIGLEIILELVEFGVKNLGKYNFENAEIFQAKEGILGIPGKMFDRILVSAAAKEFPEELIDQLKEGGIAVIPVKNSLFKVTKQKDGRIKKEEYPGFIFVPLVGR